MPEPWLRGTHTDLDPVRRQVIHALELAAEDIAHWCVPLTSRQLDARPARVAPVAFHLRHIARSLDRLLTYAEARALTDAQLAQLRSELTPSPDPVHEAQVALADAMRRICAISSEIYNESRIVGRQKLPTTVAGLLIHCAEHTQRHAGQAITTAQLVSRADATPPGAPSSPASFEDSAD